MWITIAPNDIQSFFTTISYHEVQGIFCSQYYWDIRDSMVIKDYFGMWCYAIRHQVKFMIVFFDSRGVGHLFIPDRKAVNSEMLSLWDGDEMKFAVNISALSASQWWMQLRYNVHALFIWGPAVSFYCSRRLWRDVLRIPPIQHPFSFVFFHDWRDRSSPTFEWQKFSYGKKVRMVATRASKDQEGKERQDAFPLVTISRKTACEVITSTLSENINALFTFA